MKIILILKKRAIKKRVIEITRYLGIFKFIALVSIENIVTFSAILQLESRD